MTIRRARDILILVILLLLLGKTLTWVLEPLLPLVIAGLLGLLIAGFMFNRRLH